MGITPDVIKLKPLWKKRKLVISFLMNADGNFLSTCLVSNSKLDIATELKQKL